MNEKQRSIHTPLPVISAIIIRHICFTKYTNLNAYTLHKHSCVFGPVYWPGHVYYLSSATGRHCASNTRRPLAAVRLQRVPPPLTGRRAEPRRAARRAASRVQIPVWTAARPGTRRGDIPSDLSPVTPEGQLRCHGPRTDSTPRHVTSVLLGPQTRAPTEPTGHSS